jgi:hypothetical protein
MDTLLNTSDQWVGSLLAFYNSNFFSFVKFLLGIYSAILFVNIILLLVQRGLSGDLKDTGLGMNVPAELVREKGKDKLRLKWENIRRKLESENESDYKVAIISADNIIDDLLRRMGFKGEDMEKRLAGIIPGQIENLEDLKKSHEIKKRIIHEEGFKLDKDTALATMAAYEDFLRLFEVLE